MVVSQSCNVVVGELYQVYYKIAECQVGREEVRRKGGIRHVEHKAQAGEPFVNMPIEMAKVLCQNYGRDPKTLPLAEARCFLFVTAFATTEQGQVGLVPFRQGVIITADAINQMFCLLKETGGLGLAASQVGIDARLFVTKWGEVRAFSPANATRPTVGLLRRRLL
jgi:hypothetical protein